MSEEDSAAWWEGKPIEGAEADTAAAALVQPSDAVAALEQRLSALEATASTVLPAGTEQQQQVETPDASYEEQLEQPVGTAEATAEQEEAAAEAGMEATGAAGLQEVTLSTDSEQPQGEALYDEDYASGEGQEEEEGSQPGAAGGDDQWASEEDASAGGDASVDGEEEAVQVHVVVAAAEEPWQEGGFVTEEDEGDSTGSSSDADEGEEGEEEDWAASVDGEADTQEVRASRWPRAARKKSSWDELGRGQRSTADLASPPQLLRSLASPPSAAGWSVQSRAERRLLERPQAGRLAAPSELPASLTFRRPANRRPTAVHHRPSHHHSRPLLTHQPGPAHSFSPQ